MLKIRKFLPVWPGFSSLWKSGSTFGMAAALLFGAVLNLSLLTHWVWPELLPRAAKLAILATLAAGYLPLVGLMAWWGRAGGNPGQNLAQGLLVTAQSEYLQGNWSRAEGVLRQLLRRNREDAEARLLLVGTLRRSGRADDALRQLRRLSRLESADSWNLEITREEKILLAELTPPEEDIPNDTAPQNITPDESASLGLETDNPETDTPKTDNSVTDNQVTGPPVSDSSRTNSLANTPAASLEREKAPETHETSTTPVQAEASRQPADAAELASPETTDHQPHIEEGPNNSSHPKDPQLASKPPEEDVAASKDPGISGTDSAAA